MTVHHSSVPVSGDDDVDAIIATLSPTPTASLQLLHSDSNIATSSMGISSSSEIDAAASSQGPARANEVEVDSVRHLPYLYPPPHLWSS